MGERLGLQRAVLGVVDDALGLEVGQLGQLVRRAGPRNLLHGNNGDDPVPLLATGANIWITNVIIFAIWYWELDRGGPAARAAGTDPHPDFLFPQMSDTSGIYREWEPQFTDYAYVSFTNATAFSPTDTLPLKPWAKLMMMAQSAISLVIGIMIISRAINVLN